jgi:hypothetical protein
MKEPIFISISWTTDPNTSSSETFLNNGKKLTDDEQISRHLKNGYIIKSFSICPHKYTNPEVGGTDNYITALIMLE